VATRYAAAVTAGTLFAETAVTEVWFRALGEAQIDAYVATGEGRDKAGGYAIQGIGAMLVTRIEGCYSNVVGLPLGDVIAALQSHGLLGPCPVSARP
jgi:septum formation protein